MRTIIISGSRSVVDAVNSEALRKKFNELMLRAYRGNQFDTLVHGAARGIDTWASLWVDTANRIHSGTEFPLIKEVRYPVTPDEWRTIGRSAGHKRNERMILNTVRDQPIAPIKEVTFVAFTAGLLPDSKGTAGAFAYARRVQRAYPEVLTTVKHINLMESF